MPVHGCRYCGCHTTISRKGQPILDYLDALREEIRIVTDRVPKGSQVDEVHFGGGTPTIIEPKEFTSLMELLRQRFEFTAAASVAIEIDPRTLTADMAIALGEAGVGRASLGVQSFDPVVQKAVTIESKEQTAEAVDNLRRYRVARINFDLIYGLPHQTVQSCVGYRDGGGRDRGSRIGLRYSAMLTSLRSRSISG